MGAWSCTILGSDDTLDILDNIKAYLFEEIEKDYFISDSDRDNFLFYPLETMEEEPNELNSKVKEFFGKWILDANSEVYKFNDEQWFLVVSSIAMAYGLEIPNKLKKLALNEAKNDSWGKTDEERKSYMKAFIEALNRYETGKPLFEPTEGLFDQIMNSNTTKKDISWIGKQ